jgi:chitin synthase
MYDDYKENKSVRSEDFDGRSRFTSNRDESVSTLGQSRMPPLGTCSRMLARGLMEKEALAGEIQEGEKSEVLKESLACRRWVALCWMLTFWVPTPLLTYVGRSLEREACSESPYLVHLRLCCLCHCGLGSGYLPY